jgi:hypothetical protein
VFSFIALWLSAFAGAGFLKKVRPLEKADQGDFGVVQAANLTLLGLLIGFTFSMATSRYEQRKSLEEAEANAIGTEYVRADLLPAADAAILRDLLKNYLDQRVLFYTTGDAQKLREIDINTTKLQNELWSVVQARAIVQPTPVLALAVSGMNDVLNSQGYTQAAWRNRIPFAAWGLMVAIATCCNLLVGYGAHTAKVGLTLLVVLPVVVSTSFALIADIDSPRGGIIRVSPINLMSTADSLKPN